MPVPSLNARKRDPPTGVMSGASIPRSVRLPYPTMHAGRLDPCATWRQQCRVAPCIATEPVPGRQVRLRPRLAQMFPENAVAPRESSLASLSDACVKKALCDTDGRERVSPPGIRFTTVIRQTGPGDWPDPSARACRRYYRCQRVLSPAPENTCLRYFRREPGCQAATVPRLIAQPAPSSAQRPGGTWRAAPRCSDLALA